MQQLVRALIMFLMNIPPKLIQHEWQRMQNRVNTGNSIKRYSMQLGEMASLEQPTLQAATENATGEAENAKAH